MTILQLLDALRIAFVVPIMSYALYQKVANDDTGLFWLLTLVSLAYLMLFHLIGRNLKEE